MARVSFGSRAGVATDYNNGGHANTHAFSRQSTNGGPYDSLDALGDALRSEVQAAADSSVPECTTVEFKLSLNAVIPLVRPSIGPYAQDGDHDLPYEFKNGLYYSDPDPEEGAGPKHPKAPISAIINVVDARNSQIVQRAASRGIMTVIEAVDGFRYSFNNAWAAKDGEGSRFSYICQDSMQNKDRHANGYTRVLKHLKDPTGAERGPRKPTYDCKGSVSVKFSTNRQSCDVYYRHLAIHDTVAARKPPARTSQTTKGTTTNWTQIPQSAAAAVSNAQDTGGLSATLQAEKYAASAASALAMADDPVPATPAASNISRPLKRKRTPPPPPPQPNRGPSKPLSLVELLKQSDTAQAPAPSLPTQTPRFSNKPAPIAYDLPSWQTPPPPLNVPSDSLPYPLPYQPKKSQGPITPASARPASASQRAAMNATAPQQRVYQQFRLGAPSDKQPQPQGLFTTMKQVSTPRTDGLPWPAESYNTPQHPPGPTQSQRQVSSRAKQSCTNCRFGKQRCDEGQPCASCVRRHKADSCMYEQARTAPPSQYPQPQVGMAPKQPPVWEQPQASSSAGGPQMRQQHTGSSYATPPQNWQTPAGPSSQSWQNSVGGLSQASPPLQAWGALSMAPSATVPEQSPDPEWFPKR